MPDRSPRRWQLAGFEELFDPWLQAEGLAGYGDLELIVWVWIHARARNPYAGVRREKGFDNLWWGTIPGTADGSGKVVVCTYFIHEHSSTIRCAAFGWLDAPFI